MRLLLASPSLTAELAPKQREKLEAQMRAKAEAEYAASPEGQREALEREAAEAEARAALAAKARDSLVRHGALDAEAAAALSDDEAIWSRGLERKPYELMSLTEKDAEAERLLDSGEYRAMSEWDRSVVAGQLGATRAIMDEAAGITSTGDGEGGAE